MTRLEHLLTQDGLSNKYFEVRAAFLMHLLDRPTLTTEYNGQIYQLQRNSDTDITVYQADQYEMYNPVYGPEKTNILQYLLEEKYVESQTSSLRQLGHGITTRTF